jgi:hypothetical protein
MNSTFPADALPPTQAATLLPFQSIYELQIRITNANHRSIVFNTQTVTSIPSSPTSMSTSSRMAKWRLRRSEVWNKARKPCSHPWNACEGPRPNANPTRYAG